MKKIQRIILVCFVFLILFCIMLSGCAAGEPSGSLSEEELAVFNTEFFNGDTKNRNNMMLTSEYSKPEEINLYELFYSGVGETQNQISEEELAALAELRSEAAFMDVVKVTKSQMDAFLQEMLGVSLEETQKEGIDNFCYLEEYDSYYVIAGDTNFDWCIVTSGIWEKDNTLVLEYEKEYEGGQWSVTLQKTKDGYLFLSNKKIS